MTSWASTSNLRAFYDCGLWNEVCLSFYNDVIMQEFLCLARRLVDCETEAREVLEEH